MTDTDTTERGDWRVTINWSDPKTLVVAVHRRTDGQWVEVGPPVGHQYAPEYTVLDLTGIDRDDARRAAHDVAGRLDDVASKIAPDPGLRYIVQWAAQNIASRAFKTIAA